VDASGAGKVCLLNTNLTCLVDAECGAEGPCVDASGSGKVCLLNKELSCVVDAECGVKGPCVDASGLGKAGKVCLLNKELSCSSNSDCGAKISDSSGWSGPCVDAGGSDGSGSQEEMVRGVTEGRRPGQKVPNGTITHHNGHAFANFTAADGSDSAVVADAKKRAEHAEKKLEAIAHKNRQKRQELLAKWMATNDQSSHEQAKENVDVALDALNSAHEMMAGGSIEPNTLLKSLATGIRKAVGSDFSKGGEPLEQKIIAEKLHQRAKLMDDYEDEEADKLTLLGKNDAKHDSQLKKAAQTALAATKEEVTADGGSSPAIEWTVNGELHALDEADEDAADADASSQGSALDELYVNNEKAATQLAAEAAEIRIRAREAIKHMVNGYTDTLAFHKESGGPSKATPVGYMGR